MTMVRRTPARIRRVLGQPLVYVPSFDGSWPRHRNRYFEADELLIHLGEVTIRHGRHITYDFDLVLSGRHGLCMIIRPYIG